MNLADKIVMRPIGALVPYASNARTHTPEQIDLIARSLQEYGWTNPILVDGENGIVAGHARVRAATKLGLTEVPTIELSWLTPEQRQAYVITDNQSAIAGSGWDAEMLRLELGDLKELGFDLELTGFSDIEVTALFADASRQNDRAAKNDRKLSPAEEDKLTKAWRVLVTEWADIVAAGPQILSPNVSPGTLAVHFVRSLLFGEEIPRSSSLAYTPSRFFTPGGKSDKPFSAVFKRSLSAPETLSSLRWAMSETPRFDKCLAHPLPVHGHNMPSDFPSSMARDLINEFCPPAGVVLDPCHGWGGRCLGFLLSHASHYDGFDPSPPAHAGVERMFADLAAYVEPKKTASFTAKPFETIKLAKRSYDFALTSPPYFDVERYDGEDSSWRLYPSFDEWVAGFYRPLMTSVAGALKPSAVFALQVGSQTYPLVERAKVIAPEVGLIYAGLRETGLINNYTGTAIADGEVTLILRKR